MENRAASKTGDQQTLRVLIVDDSEDDVLLIIRHLQKNGYYPAYERVDTAVAMDKALKEKQWDIILCDYKMPAFDAPSALALLKTLNMDIPVIIISGTIGEETAVECMRSGAHDYFMKSNLSRLGSAIARELEDAKIRNKHRRAVEELRESERKLREAQEMAHLGHWTWNVKTGSVEWSEEVFKIFQLDPKSFVPRIDLILDLSPWPQDHERDQELIRKAMASSDSGSYEQRFLRPDKSIGYYISSFQGKYDDNGNLIFIVGTVQDITERKKNEEALRQSEELYTKLVNTIPDIIVRTDLAGKILYVNDFAVQISGYRRDEIEGRDMLNFFLPEQHQRLLHEIALMMENKLGPRQYDLIAKDGRIIPLEINGDILRHGDGTPFGIVTVSRDISERREAEAKIQDTLDRLRKSFGTTIQVMVSAVEMRDPYTAGHQTRTADLARAIATEMGLTREQIDGIRMAGTIHDIGKLSIPSEILSKPTKLTAIEFSMIREHPRVGYEMLKDMESPWPLAQIVYQHHERLNGTGYPLHLKEEEILIEARIMAVADVVEAMSSHRPYRPALGIEIALEEIEKNKGILYDEDVANACLKLFRKQGYKLPS